jgi:hypothetical protein
LALAEDDLNLKRTVGVLIAAFAGLCLGACAEDGEKDANAEPSLSEIKNFRAYPVYYSGASVAENALTEVFGDPEQQEDMRDTTWVLIYGDCEADEGGCFPPLQIHSYSTCARWADPDSQLIDIRGAKATKPKRGSGAGLEIFTGRTTVTIGAESQAVLDSAVQALREVHQENPSRLPPPVPGSLRGQLPCQDRSG